MDVNGTGDPTEPFEAAHAQFSSASTGVDFYVLADWTLQIRFLEQKINLHLGLILVVTGYPSAEINPC